MDYRFEEMVQEAVRNNLTLRHTLINRNGEDYQICTELFWRGVLFNSFYQPFPKDPGLKLAEKL